MTVFHWKLVSADETGVVEDVGMVIERAKETRLMDLLAGTVSQPCVIFILFAAVIAWRELGDLSLWLFVHSHGS